MKKILLIIATLLAVAGCNDTSSLEDNNSVSELPDFVAATNIIEGWSETRFAQDGTVYFSKKNKDGMTTDILIYLPDEKHGYLPLYACFDANEIPSYIVFGDTEVYIVPQEDETLDITLATEEVLWNYNGVDLSELDYSQLSTKAWSDNNAVRNICALGNIVTGTIGVGSGVFMIMASGIAEVVSATASTPVSVLGAGLGLYNIKSGCDAITDGFGTIFGPANMNDNSSVWESYYMQSVAGIAQESICDWIQALGHKNRFVKKFIPDQLLKQGADIGKLGTVAYWTSFGFNTLDKVFGKTYDKEAEVAKVHDRINVLTNEASNITDRSATLFGYVSPEGTKPLGKHISTEVAIVLYEAGNLATKDYHSIIDGEGGNVSFTFTDLKPDTEYIYYTVFHDREYGYFRSGEELSFRTSSKLVVPSLVSIESSDCSFHHAETDDWIGYSLTFKIGDGVIPDYATECGIYCLSGDTKEKFCPMDKSESQKTIGFGISCTYFNQVATFKARCSMKFGFYLITPDGVMYSDPKEHVFVYDKKPSVKIRNLRQGETYSIPAAAEGDPDRRVDFSYDVYIDGAFFIEDLAQVYEGVGQTRTYHHGRVSDKCYEVNTWVAFPSVHVSVSIESIGYFIANAGGVGYMSETIVYSFSGDNCKISLKTRSASTSYDTHMMHGILVSPPESEFELNDMEYINMSNDLPGYFMYKKL